MREKERNDIFARRHYGFLHWLSLLDWRRTTRCGVWFLGVNGNAIAERDQQHFEYLLLFCTDDECVRARERKPARARRTLDFDFERHSIWSQFEASQCAKASQIDDLAAGNLNDLCPRTHTIGLTAAWYGRTNCTLRHKCVMRIFHFE